MKNYIGVKEIKAKSMTLGEYNDLRGWVIPAEEDPKKEGYLVEYAVDPTTEPNHPNYEGYVSWSPKEVFEKAYVEYNLENVSREGLAPHQERVVDEYYDLIEKHNKLFMFFDTDIFKGLDPKEKSRMKNQFLTMGCYAVILRERIINF